MRRLDVFKLALAGCAVLLFAWGIRVDATPYRWAAIACLAAAFALRFVGPKR